MTLRERPLICHIARDIELSGGGEVVKQVARNSALRGARVVLVTDTRGVDLGPGVKVHMTPFGGRLLAWCPNSRIAWLLRHAAMIIVFTVSSSVVGLYYRALGYVVFNHNCESLVGQILVMHNVFSAELIARKLGSVRTVVAMLNPVRLIRISKEIILSRSFLRKRLISVSEAAVSEVVWLAGDADRVSTIPNGVDIARYSKVNMLPVPEKVDSWKKSSEISHVVLFVGHEWKRKGLDELLEALVLLPTNIGLLIVGGKTQDLNLYLDRTKKMGIAARVLFAGEQKDIDNFYALADVFCLPSHYETMPLVALEALASGTPVVLTKECPAIQYVVAGKNGEISTHDPASIASSILRSLSYGETSEGRLNIRHAVQELDWSGVADAYLAAAESVLMQTKTLSKKSQ